jgi:hypothetical protein
MLPGDHIRKSALGRTALAGRAVELTAPLRTLLLMIYGDKTAAEYSQLASQLPVGRDGLARLAELGLVEVVVADGSPPAQPAVAAVAPQAALVAPAPAFAPSASAPLSAPMADVVALQATHTVDEAAQQKLLYPEFVRAVSGLGLRSVLLLLKVERAMSAKDLLALREQVETAIAKSKGEQARQEFSQRVSFLLAQ